MVPVGLCEAEALRLAPHYFSDISCFSWPCNSSPSIALFGVAVYLLQQFIFMAPHISADHLVHCLPYFPLPSVSPNIFCSWYLTCA